MQLIKRRDFNALISDTFSFFKVYGRNYFRNYFILNGLPMILMMVLFFFFYRAFLVPLARQDFGMDAGYFDSPLDVNLPLLLVLVLVGFLLFIAFYIITYSYPVLYLKRISETGATEIQLDEISGDIRRYLGKAFKFMLGVLFIITPLLFVFFGISVFLMILLIGFFLLLLAAPVVYNIINFTLFDYYHSGRNFFQSLSYSFNAQFNYQGITEKSPFWKYWGSSIIILFIIQSVIGVITMIPYILFMVAMYSSAEAANFDSFSSTNMMWIAIAYALSFLLMFVLNNVMYVCCGLMYYDSRTDLQRNEDFSEIDQIGKNL